MSPVLWSQRNFPDWITPYLYLNPFHGILDFYRAAFFPDVLSHWTNYVIVHRGPDRVRGRPGVDAFAHERDPAAVLMLEMRDVGVRVIEMKDRDRRSNLPTVLGRKVKVKTWPVRHLDFR